MRATTVHLLALFLSLSSAWPRPDNGLDKGLARRQNEGEVQTVGEQTGELSSLTDQPSTSSPNGSPPPPSDPFGPGDPIPDDQVDAERLRQAQKAANGCIDLCWGRYLSLRPQYIIDFKPLEWQIKHRDDSEARDCTNTCGRKMNINPRYVKTPVQVNGRGRSPARAGRGGDVPVTTGNGNGVVDGDGTVNTDDGVKGVNGQGNSGKTAATMVYQDATKNTWDTMWKSAAAAPWDQVLVPVLTGVSAGAAAVAGGLGWGSDGTAYQGS